MWWVGKRGVEGTVSVKVRRSTDLTVDELIGVETRHRYKPLQLLTPRLSYRGSHETHTHTCRHAHTHLVQQQQHTDT